MFKLLKRLLVALVLGLALYSLLGFIVLPEVGQRLINQQLAHYTSLPAHLKKIQLNPFTLELSLHEFRLGTEDKPQLSFECFYTQLDWRSLWLGRIQVRSLSLEKPFVQIQLDPKGQLNAQSWFKLPPSDPSSKSSGLPLSIHIEHIALVNGHAQFEDLGPKEAIRLNYDQINLSARDFSTQENAIAELLLSLNNAQTQQQQLSWKGQVKLDPLLVNGQLKLEALELNNLRPYIQQAAPLVVEQGQLNLSSQVQLSLPASGLQLLLDDLSLDTKALRINAPDKRPLIRLEQLSLAKTSVNLAEQRLQIGKIHSQKLETWLAREADGELDWQKLFSNNSTTKSNPAQTKAPANKSSATEKPWQLQIATIQLRNYQIHAADRQPKEAVQLEVGPLNLDVSQIDTQSKRPLQFELNTGLGSKGRLKAQGQFNLATLAAQVQVNTQDVDLRLAQSYLSPLAQVELRSGLLNTTLDVAVTQIQPLALQVTGQAEITQWHLLDAHRKQELIKWQRLHIAGIDYRHEQSLNIQRISLVQPYTRFVINPDLSSNFSTLLVKQTPEPAKKVPVQAAPKSINATKPMGIRIGSIQIINGSGYFADLSLKPDFATSIQTLSGDIGTLDNQSTRPAKVVIRGKVDRYSPLSIEGTLTPFDPLQNLDITTRFKQVEMTTLTPYSGKFAGYRIRKGRLDLDLHYRIQGKRLKAENQVVIHQLQLGERVDSDAAADLPIRLAIALLKDSSGTIHLDLPIEGNLEDPSFSIMPLLGKTLGNMLSKAVQAPFSLLGSLMDFGGADPNKIPFNAGQTELSTEAKTTLNALAKALKDRPDLMLEVEGASSPTLDGPSLAQQKLEQAYRALWYQKLQSKGERLPSSPDKLQISDQAKASLLEELYPIRLKQQPPNAWKSLSAQERQTQLQQAVLKSWNQDQASMRQLSQARAQTIKDYLVQQGGINNIRIYLVDSNLSASSENNTVASTLYLAGQ